ncbi:MAG: hypothetical protein MJ146_02180 [Clostridia bacterium]|nr:hypothetical protein [Clostridia bacterium]
MDTKELTKKARAVGLGISLSELICGVLGIYAFYADSALLSIFGGIVLALTIAQILMGHQVLLPILGCAIGAIAVGVFWKGICIGICFEAVIASVFAYILVLVTKFKGPPEPIQEEQKENEE